MIVAVALRHARRAPCVQGGTHRRVPSLEVRVQCMVQLRNILVGLGVAFTIVIFVAKIVDELRTTQAIAVKQSYFGDVGVFTGQACRHKKKRRQENTRNG